MPKTSSPERSALLANLQILPAGNISTLQETALAQLVLIRTMERDAALRAILVGFALHRIKAALKHGEFLPWIKKHVAQSHKQCSFYMRLAVVFAEDARLTQPELLAVPADRTELALDTTDKVARRFLGKAMKFVGEKSLNELLNEHGIRDAGALGGARDKNARGAKSDAPDAEQLYLFARDEIGGVIQRAEEVFLKENKLQHLLQHPEEVRGVVASLRSLADKVEEAAKPLLGKSSKP
jgi:hypothetical protein